MFEPVDKALNDPKLLESDFIYELFDNLHNSTTNTTERQIYRTPKYIERNNE